MDSILRRSPNISPAFDHLFHDPSEDGNLCSTDWINGTTIQFIAFSVKNFSEVNIMMPAEFSGNNEAEYSCIFHQEVNQINMPVKKLGGSRVLDASRRTLHLRCAVPDEIHISNRQSVIMTLDLGNGETYQTRICRTYRLFANGQQNQNNSVDTARIIQFKNPEPPAAVACCTMINYGYIDHLKIWLNYNILIGIKHFYIYDNAPRNTTQLIYDLKDYVEAGYVTIVPWYPEIWRGFTFYSSNWIKHQIWSQNDCIQRYGYKHEWIGIFDIDEYPILPQEGIHKLTEILHKIPAKFCSVVVKNCFPLNSKIITTKLLNNSLEMLTFFHQDTINTTSCHTRPKHFVRPSKIYYFRIHWLEGTINCEGSYNANFKHELRVNHYKHSYPKMALKHDNGLINELNI